MSFTVEFTQSAADQVRNYRKFDQKIILDGIAAQLTDGATTETRNRKRLSANELSDWELRIERFRVFYDVEVEEKRQAVKIKAVGHKEHDTLYIGGKEVKL